MRKTETDDGEESCLGKFQGQMPSSCICSISGDALKQAVMCVDLSRLSVP